VGGGGGAIMIGTPTSRVLSSMDRLCASGREVTKIFVRLGGHKECKTLDLLVTKSERSVRPVGHEE
jgi:hypothetical protein